MPEPPLGDPKFTGARARALLGNRAASDSSTESTEGAGPPSDADAARMAKLIEHNAQVSPETARAMAAEIVSNAQAAMQKLENAETGAPLSDAESLALESVIHVRSRPALRVQSDVLESLGNYPGSELWQNFIADYEEGIMEAAAATGAVIVSKFGSGNPPWVQGSAWLIAPNRVLTNRHVLLSKGLKLIRRREDKPQLASDVTLAIEFAADNRSPAASVRHKITEVLYVAPDKDPVDIAVLAIEPAEDWTPLKFAGAGVSAPKNLFVVGHPAPMANVPAAVKAVFGNPDGRKRVSFGKLLSGAPSPRDILHDASTVGGYSGGPVVGITSGKVAGLHYYGDPASGNLAASAATIQAHTSHKHWQSS
jgi:hypothetical protein